MTHLERNIKKNTHPSSIFLWQLWTFLFVIISTTILFLQGVPSYKLTFLGGVYAVIGIRLYSELAEALNKPVAMLVVIPLIFLKLIAIAFVIIKISDAGDLNYNFLLFCGGLLLFLPSTLLAFIRSERI